MLYDYHCLAAEYWLTAYFGALCVCYIILSA